jgi:hypothetical protein
MSSSVYFPSCSDVGLERIVDGELHGVRGKRAVCAGLIDERNRELVAIRQRPRDGLAPDER